MRSPKIDCYDHDVNSFVTPPGNELQPLYKSHLAADGTIVLKQYDTINIRQMINSYRDSCDMAWILRRLNQGDNSVLYRNSPQYGDFTNLPTTLAEAMQLSNDAESAFLSLPLEIRHSFNDDFRQWFASAGSRDWFDKMKGQVVPAADPAPVPAADPAPVPAADPVT